MTSDKKRTLLDERIKELFNVEGGRDPHKLPKQVPKIPKTTKSKKKATASEATP